MTYRGGSANPTSWRKQQRFYEIVKENRLPLILLNESAGADLPRQADIFVQGGGELPRPHPAVEAAASRRSRVVFGPSTAGGAYMPGHERLHGVRQGPAPRSTSAGRRW